MNAKTTPKPARSSKAASKAQPRPAERPSEALREPMTASESAEWAQMQALAAKMAAHEEGSLDDERERLGVMQDLTDGVLRLRMMQDVMRLAEPSGRLQVGTVRKLFDCALDPLEKAVVELAGVLDVPRQEVCKLVNRARPALAF